jgi:hypothetical protein
MILTKLEPCGGTIREKLNKNSLGNSLPYLNAGAIPTIVVLVNVSGPRPTILCPIRVEINGG